MIEQAEYKTIKFSYFSKVEMVFVPKESKLIKCSGKVEKQSYDLIVECPNYRMMKRLNNQKIMWSSDQMIE